FGATSATPRLFLAQHLRGERRQCGPSRLACPQLAVLARRAGGRRQGSRAQPGARRAAWAFSRTFRRGGAPCASVAAVVSSRKEEGRQATKVGLFRAGERLERSRGFGR